MFWNKIPKNDHNKLVMAFGTFDILHAGHEHLLRQAKEYGDEVLVILARDDTVKSVKGEYPTNNEKNRLKNLRQTEWADHVLLGNYDDKYKVILKYKPQTIVLGYDQFIFTQRIEKTLIDANIDAKVVRLMPYHPQVYKSSLLKEQLKDQNVQVRQNKFERASN